ncbi:DUF58 domain-containing protein [Roseivivax isoporae]|uniref:DUF58 domain-containing protein n=1 Tax=Roseivivax isoporae LMG 25204 TaxID=1449351 RepID=X7F9B8_9RHOB|nr:DUF58 domain-containing protein [Roseivivax isoporae]ETX28669.1 hypothetical protein RISW2_05065 [Roseivivax isoporae LMG 25204]
MTDALAVPGVALRAEALIGLRRVALAQAGSPALAALPGGFVTRRRGHGQEVADVREYVPGDDIRHLDRGSTARTGRLHVRQFQEERDRVTLLVADMRPSMLWGTARAFRSVAAAEALALVGWRTVTEGGRVGLLALSAGDPVAVPVRGRSRGMLDVIGGLVRAHEAALALALAGTDRDPTLEQGLTRVERIAPRGAEVVIASGFDVPGPGLSDRLAALAQGRVSRLLSIVDGGVRRLPRGIYPMRLPDGTRVRVRSAGDPVRPGTAEPVAGLPVIEIDAAEAPDRTAQTIAAAFPADREP